MVRAQVTGPSGQVTVRLVLDTGASWSTLPPAALSHIGIEPSTVSVEIASVTGLETATFAVVTSFAALGQRREEMSLLAIQLPRRMPFDGILGLDFFRGHRLVLDFRDGTLEFD